MRGFLALGGKRAGQGAEDVQIQARGGVGAGVVLVCFEGARVLGGVLDLLLGGGGGFGDLVGGHGGFYLTTRVSRGGEFWILMMRGISVSRFSSADEDTLLFYITLYAV